MALRRCCVAGQFQASLFVSQATVLSGTIISRGVVFALACAAAFPANAPIVPLTICEVVRDLGAHEGKDEAVLGRYSFRASSGRYLSEQACDPTAPVPPQLLLVEDLKDGPKPPDSFELDGEALRRKFADLRKRTQLGKFRFGTPDYDRWAVVYGRVEARKGDEKFPASLAFRGDGVVVFLRPDQ